ncbi:unnamed protein product [Orchesella dallaii]|uniref:Peptidase metallopeptidase domain-containing protein n=1 Tax=Orchesella dallaii TaxID=48710 RepID=A0ABP1RYL0_9HEXA
MTTPRCGVSDKSPEDRRASNYVLQGSKWEKEFLKYRIHSYPHNACDIGRLHIHSQIDKAFSLWRAAAANVYFSRQQSNELEADIKIFFGSREHGDGYAFDGQGGTLAHAFYPRFGGDIHFDDDESWSIESKVGINLFQVTVHEIGHSIGLGHSKIRGSVMEPFYGGYNPNFTLHSDDIQAIRKLYGLKTRWNGTHNIPYNPSCLKKGTKIFMADMSEKPVEFLQIGDIVLDKNMHPTRVLGVSYEFLLEQKFYGFDNQSFFFTNSHLFAGPSVENEGDMRFYAKSTKTLFHNNPLMKYLNVSDMDDHEKHQLYHHDGKNSVSVRNVTVSQDPQEYPPEIPIYFIQVDSPTGTYIANGYVCRHEIPPIELWPNTMSILFRLMETEAFQKISLLPYTLETISYLHNVIDRVATEVKLFLEGNESRKGDYGKPKEIMRLEDVGVEESIGKIFGNPTLSTAGVNLYARVGSIISPYLDDIEESKWKVERRQVAALQSDLYVVIRNELEKYF